MGGSASYAHDGTDKQAATPTRITSGFDASLAEFCVALFRSISQARRSRLLIFCVLKLAQERYSLKGTESAPSAVSPYHVI